ncbi:MAG TPA: restriction endonuclease subunit S [Candidatus Binatia bacterium]
MGTIFPGVPCAIGRDIYAYEPHRALSTRFMEHALRFTIGKVAAKAAGDIPGLSKSHILDHEMLLPPEAEQHRIVAEIEKHFTRLDAAVAALERVRANLKRYRAAALKAACEGRLVPTEAELARREGRTYEPADQLLARILKERRARWEADQLAKMQAKAMVPKDEKWKAKYRQPEKPEPPNGARAAAGWSWAGLEELSEGVPHALKAGPFGSSLKKSVYVPRGYKIYGQEQVIRGDAFFGDYYIDEARYRQLESCRVQPADLLISLVGTAGRVLILPENIAPGIINPRLLKATLNRSGVNPRFIKILLESPGTRQFFKLAAHGGTMEILNLSILKQIPLALPPLPEQHRIVAEVERRLSVIDELEAVVDANLKRAERLRQAILKRAFEGKLVPQDPNDEPASVLLERIRAERALATSGNSGGRGSRRAPTRRNSTRAAPALRHGHQ